MKKEGQGTEDISFFAYDALNQIVKTTTGAKTALYKYNGDGLRVEKTADGQVTRYLYESDKVILELDGQGNQTARNVQGLNLLARTMDGSTVYFMYNAHADVTALLDTAGIIKATYYYDAFGSPMETTGEANNPYRYAGYQYDSETEIYYLNARYYDPKIARFLTEDSYRGDPNDPLSLNLYTYCHNEPIMYTDPTGHSEARDKLIEDKKIQQKIDNATTDWNSADKAYKACSISKAEKDRRQASAHKKAEDARTNYVKTSQDIEYVDKRYGKAVANSVAGNVNAIKSSPYVGVYAQRSIDNTINKSNVLQKQKPSNTLSSGAKPASSNKVDEKSNTQGTGKSGNCLTALNGEKFEANVIKIDGKDVLIPKDPAAYGNVNKNPLESHSTLDMIGATPGINFADGADVVEHYMVYFIF